jgi:hypothetical protein
LARIITNNKKFLYLGQLLPIRDSDTFCSVYRFPLVIMGVSYKVATTFNLMTPSKTPYSIITLSIKGSFATLSITTLSMLVVIVMGVMNYLLLN